MQLNAVTGQTVMQKELYKNSNIIETTGLINGMYILSFRSKGDIQTQKLQIKK